MQFAIPSRPTLARYAGVALLTCGNIATIYGAWQLRGMFGSPFGYSLANALIPFALLCLPLVAICALFELRGFKLSRLVGLDVKPGESPWISAVGFGVLGAGWVFVKGGMSDREATKAEAALAKPTTAAESQHKPSPGREAIETVVFVVVLVLMLKLFVVEAFVIPTGSMAETLYGYKKWIECEDCHFQFPVNASDEAEPSPGRTQQKVTGYCCPNCRYENPNSAKTVSWTSGDRVLVGKFLNVDDRGHVVVFKFPDAPQTSQTAQNYIKRLVGLPGETIAIYNGDLYVTRAIEFPRDPSVKDLDLWRKSNTHAGDRNARELFSSSRAGDFRDPNGFQIIRKPDDLVLAVRRIVYDNDHQSAQISKAGHPPRWQVDNTWKADQPTSPKVFTHADPTFGWVRYQHLMPPHELMQDPRSALIPPYHRPGWVPPATDVKLAARKITNYSGYNGGFPESAKAVPQTFVEKEVAKEERDKVRKGELSEKDARWDKDYQDHMADSDYWVGDLLLECTATVGEGGAVVLQLSKGDHSYRAEFDGGVVRVKMFPNDEEYTREDGNKTSRPRTVVVGDDNFTKATQSIGMKPGTTHRLRFANVDCRMRVWVDDTPIDFDGKGDYDPPKGADRTDGSTAADVEWPACIGAKGTAQVSALKLWRDTHYVNASGDTVDTYFVQPGHYLCMGDNSSQSSDGRMWGLVPERLMLGRAVFIFWPFERVGFIR